MKSSKIKSVTFNNKTCVVTIQTSAAALDLPYSKLMLKPSPGNGIKEAYVDKELAQRCVTFMLKDGQEDSVPIEAFWEYNRDPDYMREIELYKLTTKAISLVKASNLSKRFICRQMGTSLSQLSRLLDPKNQKKTIDQMLRLITILGADFEIKVAAGF